MPKKSLVRVVQETKYRLGIRKALQKASIEELHIALEETKREINRRNEQ